MKLSISDCFVLSTAIEHLYLTPNKCYLNKKGIGKLANIYARLGNEILEVDTKAIEKKVKPLMLK